MDESEDTMTEIWLHSNKIRMMTNESTAMHYEAGEKVYLTMQQRKDTIRTHARMILELID